MIGWNPPEVTLTWLTHREPVIKRIARAICRLLYVLFWAACWWWLVTVGTSMCEPIHAEAPKMTPALTFDERHPQGWAEWGNMYMGAEK